MHLRRFFLSKIVEIYAVFVCKIFARKSGRVIFLTNLKSVTVLGVDDLSQGSEREILAVKSRWQILLRGQPGSCKGDLQVSNPLETHQGLIIRPVQFLLLCLPDGHGLAAARRRRPPSVQVPLDPARLFLPLLPLRQKTIKSYPHVCKGCCWSLC